MAAHRCIDVRQVYPLEIRPRTRYGRAAARERAARSEAEWNAAEDARVGAEVARAHAWQARAVEVLEGAGYEWNNLVTFAVPPAGRNWQVRARGFLVRVRVCLGQIVRVEFGCTLGEGGMRAYFEACAYIWFGLVWFGLVWFGLV